MTQPNQAHCPTHGEWLWISGIVEVCPKCITTVTLDGNKGMDRGVKEVGDGKKTKRSVGRQDNTNKD